jgi:hypothetical protein
MRVSRVLLLMFLSFASRFCRADECASLIPEPGRKLVSDAHEWKILDLKDLPADDASIWAGAHSGQCPGVAVGDFTGGHTPSYAIAMIRKEPSGKYVEQLVLLVARGETFTRLTVASSKSVISPFVVWTLPPGKYRGVDQHASVSVPHDSFVYEKMEAFATQYYYADGRLHSLVTAD